MTDNLPNTTDATTDTGLGKGMEPTGIAIGGTLDSPSSEGVGGSTDTDTGLDFGPGQSTTTGTLPTQGGASMDGPVELDTSRDHDVPHDIESHSLTSDVTSDSL